MYCTSTVHSKQTPWMMIMRSGYVGGEKTTRREFMNNVAFPTQDPERDDDNP